MKRALRKAVKEYYEWHGDRKAKPVDFITNKKSGDFKMLLVRFTDADGNEMSALMEYQEWKDGHWDVTEDDVVPRKCEHILVSDFENDQNYL